MVHYLMLNLARRLWRGTGDGDRAKRLCRSCIPGSVIMLSLAVIAVSTQPVPADDFIRMHVKAEQLPFRHMGPFITRGDGAILAVDKRTAMVSRDDGKTWQSFPLFRDADQFLARPERGLVRTQSGVVVFAFLNEKEKKYDRQGSSRDHFLPTYVTRSQDDGETWDEPREIQGGWCGAVRQIIQLSSGRLVLPAQNSLHDPWRHVALSFVSDDDGHTWQRSNIIELEGHGSHGGAMEPTVIDRADGSLYMLIRTSHKWQDRVWFWEATSTDAGLTWTQVRNSGILASTCCGTLSRLSDGRVSLLWNRPEANQPYNPNTRAALSMAFSNDECKSWTKPVVVSHRPLQADEKYYMARQSYPYLYERRPGEAWITTMQGGLRMKLVLADVVPAPTATGLARPPVVVAFGSSTTARRAGVRQVYEQRLAGAFPEVHFVNAGVPSDTTEHARRRLGRDILAMEPCLVIIQLGGNDAAIDVWKGATTPRVSPHRYEENLRSMVQTLKQHDAEVILMTAGMFRWTPKLKELYGKPPYDPDDRDGFNLMLRSYADIVRRVARDEGARLVDLFKAHEQYDRAPEQSVDGLFLDGMHPNDDGHALAADLLLPHVRALLQTDGTR